MNIISEDENTYTEAVTLAENLFGRLDIKVASALADLADFYATQGNFDKAQVCDSRIFVILENVHGACAYATQPIHRAVYS